MNPVLFIVLTAFAVILLVTISSARRIVTIYPPNVGLLYRDGRFKAELAPGRYVHFDPFKRTRIVTISKAELPVMLGESTVVSKDQFSFRIGLSPVVGVSDARAFAESQPAIEPSRFPYVAQAASHPALPALLAGAAVNTVAAHSLRDILADPDLVANGIQAKLADAIPGAEIERILLTSITLPPETRKMFTEVERSKLEAEAALERARGEHAALRALANAARLVNDNPALVNLRFLQMLEQSPGAKTIVLGSSAVPLTSDASGVTVS